ncbi:hypothetical protein MtrunA17_Chr7g0260411 [Medicago truncatula]|uniref:Uncharacterized protein n=1 Tax=Medicago truncatula TaxID=3880 RepID=A0A396HA70_MEDTR|nr:hypothetical protein MtrunA17_Chr7g0260411 [Medicago truncatula]
MNESCGLLLTTSCRHVHSTRRNREGTSKFSACFTPAKRNGLSYYILTRVDYCCCGT